MTCKLSLMAALCAAGLLTALPASAATTTYGFDATVTSIAGNGFSAPIFDYFNLSSSGVTIQTARIYDGPPWDWVILGAAPFNIVDPAGGTRTLLEGQEVTFNTNDGCSNGIKYGFTSFDTGDSFHYSADPESSGCGNAVVDVRPFLTGNQLTAQVDFGGGVVLTGNTWALEFIDPNANHALDSNQRYRLALRSTVTTVDPPGGVPEPATWALMIGGFGMAGVMLRRKARLSRA